ncbi:High affinity methionine permease [Rasamsonia emersonii CBS 393.64]|uniref:High affinity methionine permease n=1 Tax=Rasamsonia emersonii (strain ATCC 16479 / CBS 393.64 / IMI 116815) TaxID=1408163 RepID=A0A0F4YZ04_RASE3|nr:High affinity methionine permease [Rasamsonia emersonii CBS 393.64]KKA22853.1 High affinity methionine permease [Rasamsonia emersonii CBS 393.64]
MSSSEALDPTIQKSTLPDVKHTTEEAPRKVDGISQLYESNVFNSTPESRRQIGVVSASFLIFNRIIGTGIFATPSSILELTGSVGLSLFIWVAGMLIAVAGTAVYLEWGTAIPRNGGEKNYLEYVYTKPKFLATAMFAAYAVLLGWAAGNSVIFGEYILNAAQVEVTRWNQRGVGLACISAAFLIHATALKWGLRLQNFLGTIKLIIILIIVVTGWVALGGHLKVEKPDNFSDAFAGPAAVHMASSRPCQCHLAFIGYSNANYALSETRNPTRTLKIAAPMAVISVGILYILVNIAYFAAVPKADILSSGQILAATFFRNMFGDRAERVMSVFVALSAFGNVLSVLFSQGRIVQELGREGVLPFSKIWASNWPFNSPAAGLFEHYLVSVIIMLAPPPGDAYNFLLNLISYPLSIVNVFVSGGLIYIYLNRSKFPSWAPGIRASLPVAIFFFLSNIYLVVAPYVPPDAGESVYKELPYYLHCVVAIGIFAIGAIYYIAWAIILPRLGKYTLVKETIVGDDGWSRSIFTRVPENVVSRQQRVVRTSGGEGDNF